MRHDEDGTAVAAFLSRARSALLSVEVIHSTHQGASHGIGHERTIDWNERHAVAVDCLRL